MKLGGKVTTVSQPELNLRNMRQVDSPNLARVRNDARFVTTKPSPVQSSFQHEMPSSNTSDVVSKSFSINQTKSLNGQPSFSKELQRSPTTPSNFEDQANTNKQPKNLRYSTSKTLQVSTDIETNAVKPHNLKDLSLKSTTSTQATNDVLENTQKSGLYLGSGDVLTMKHGASTFANKIEMPTTNANGGGRLVMSMNLEQKSPPPDEMALVASTKYQTEVQNGFTPSGSRYKFLSNHKTANLPYFDPTKCSSKKNGIIKAYAANTNQGLVRNYNEDRVAIILNIMRPPHYDAKDEWPVCSYFGIYDGHGGTACADFLRDNLHQFVIRDRNFPTNPEQALRNGFANAEKQFMELAQQGPYEVEKSGSCAVVVLIVDDVCYVANLGDSRAVLSAEKGKKIIPLSDDHKPCEEFEKSRILAAGGKIYQSQIPQPQKQGSTVQKVLLGPVRVLPGRLSVSRTFGDIEAKLPKLGGNPNVIIATPDIRSFKVTKEHDFILLGCDGIFDRLDNDDVVGIIWEAAQQRKAADTHKQSAVCVETLMKETLVRKSLDNITVVMVALSGFKRTLFPKNKRANPLHTNITNVTARDWKMTQSSPAKATSMKNGLIGGSSNNKPKSTLTINPQYNSTPNSSLPNDGKLENVPDEPQIRMGYLQKSPHNLTKSKDLNKFQFDFDAFKIEPRAILSGSITSKDPRKIVSAFSKPRERIPDSNKLNLGMNMSQNDVKFNRLNK